MTKFYDLYGTRALAIEDLRSAVEHALTVRLERHESDYLGGDYFLGGDLRGEHLLLQHNYSDALNDEEPAEPQFADYLVLLQVNATPRGDELKERLLGIDGVDFLRRSAP